MKRLIKKAFGQTLYHGTSLENLEKITEMQAISPQETGGAGLHEDLVSEMASKRTRDEVKELNLDYEEGSKEIYEIYEKHYNEIVEESNRKLDGYTFFSNSYGIAYEYATDYSGPRVVIETSLPEDSLLPDDTDCPDCKDWQESLNEVKQVKVLGMITSDYITGVYITNENSGEPQYFPKLTWKEQFQNQKNLQTANIKNKLKKRG